MQEKIEFLYGKLKFISMVYLNTQRVGNVEAVKEYMPQITEFATWFLQANIFGIESELYQALCNNLLDILRDILQATENGDRVLLNDAIEYGLMDYLEMFVDVEDAADE